MKGVTGCQGDPAELRTGCWAGDKGALPHHRLREVTPTPLSLCAQGAATKERERVEKLFAEASEVLATFQKEVASFIEDGERSMLGEAEADLRWKEERRAKLAQCKQNLENVPSTDTIYFLQVPGRDGARRRS